MATTLVPTTELEAVNLMLSTIGEAPVNDLSDSGLGDVSAASTRLHSVSRKVQTEGWHFNTEIDYPLSPTIDGYLLVPANTLRVDTTKEYGDKDVTLRGSRLYDRKEHTYVFTDTLKVELVVFLAFTDLPEAARNYIAIKAAREFQTSVLGSEQLESFTQDDEMEARALMLDAELETADHNMLNGSYSVANILER